MPENYLDQIAVTGNKKSLLSPRPALFGIIAGVVLLLVIIGSIAAGVYNSSQREPWQLLVARLDAAEAIAANGSKEIKSSQLRSLNSEIRLFMTNTKRDLETPLATLKFDKKKIPSSIIAKESSAPALERLEDARLNAIYDRAYVREMTYQLTQLLSSLQQAYNVSSSSTKDMLSKTYSNLESTHKSLSDYKF